MFREDFWIPKLTILTSAQKWVCDSEHFPDQYSWVSSSILAMGALQGPAELTPFLSPVHIPTMPHPKGAHGENAQFWI